MSTPKITVEHNGVTYTGRIGRIKSTSLGFEDHGILSAMLHFEWDGGGIGVGGFYLDMPKDRAGRDYTRTGTAYGLDHIMRLMETVGVNKWENLPGNDAIVLFSGNGGWGTVSVGIAGLSNGQVFILKDHAKEWIATSAVIA